MIGRLTGVVIERDPADGCCILDVCGVGYEVFVPLRCMAALAAPPDEVTLHVHTHVREESLTLFGFVDALDRVTFRALTAVSGVGPKLAMAILGDMSPPQLGTAVHAADKKRLGAISGVGKKLAARLVLELKEKVAPAPAGSSGSPGAPGSPGSPGSPGADGASGEGAEGLAHQADSVAVRACEALTQMGFSRSDAERAIDSLDEATRQQAVEVVLRRALAVLAG